MDLNVIPSDHIVNSLKFEENNAPIFNNEQEQICRVVEIGNKDMKLEEINGRIRVFGDEKLRIEEEIKGLEAKKAAFVREEMVGDDGEVEGDEKLRIEEEIKGLKAKKAAFVGPEVVEGDEKLTVEEEIKGLEAKKAAFVGVKVERDEGELSMVDELKVANKVLECEKNAAIKEVEIWKQKCKELESLVLELKGKVKCQGEDGTLSGIKGTNPRIGDDVCALRGSKLPPDGVMAEGTPDKHTEDAPTNKIRIRRPLRRRLAFQNLKSCDEKNTLLTPAEARPSSSDLMDIVDSENDCDVLSRHEPNSQSDSGMVSEDCDHEAGGTLDGVHCEEEKSGGRADVPSIMTSKAKRKRDLMVVTSDDECEFTPNKRALRMETSDNEDEDDDTPIRRSLNRVSSRSENDESDDDIPISQLQKNRVKGSRVSVAFPNPTRPRRRLVKYGQGEQKAGSQEVGNHLHLGIPATTKNVVDNESSEDESENSVKSLSSFIVDDSEIEEVEVDDASKEDSGDDSYESEDSSDDNLDFKGIISRLQNRRQPNSKWTSEGDMLSDFGKNPELCMKAVCAVYRCQTNEEKACKASLIPNGRGFSKFDATRGTYLGDFLTGGNPNGDLVKSVEELQEYDRRGLEDCRRLADHYSKQLFRIYEDGDDPFFP